MTKHEKNQQSEQDKITESGWVIKLPPIFATLIPASKQDTDVMHISEHYVDISKFKNLELQLEKAKKQLQAEELVKIDLLKNIGHSINIPCSGIVARITVLYEIEQNPEIKEYLATIIDCSKLLLDYSNDLIDFLQHYAGLTSTVLKPFDPKKLVEQSINKLMVAAQCKGLRLVSNIHYEMPDIVVGDNSRLQAVLDQLISNSIKFTKTGMVVVTVNLFSTKSFSQDDNSTNYKQTIVPKDMILQIIVHDTGIGIPEEKQQYICEEFIKFNSTIQCQGLGLGLMFVKQLIEEMHGEIELNSEEGKNTTITLSVPVKLPLISEIVDN